MPLWVQYADDGKGCCLVFKNNVFDKEVQFEYIPKENINKSFVRDINSDKKDVILDLLDNSKNIATIYKSSVKDISSEKQDKYVLYDVKYIDTNNMEDIKNIINKIVVCVKNIYAEINPPEKEKYKDTAINIIANIIDQIRFLFKHKDYEHERELRVIKMSNKYYSCLGDDNIPRLYINMNKDKV